MTWVLPSVFKVLSRILGTHLGPGDTVYRGTIGSEVADREMIAFRPGKLHKRYMEANR